MMGVLRWRHDLRSEAAAQQQQEQQQQRTGADRSAHTFPKLLSQVSALGFGRYSIYPLRVDQVDQEL